MHILNSKRVWIDRPITIGGVLYPHLYDASLRSSLGVMEMPDPVPPADYSPDVYSREEIEDAPYIVYTPIESIVPQSVTPAQGLMALYVLHQITEADIHAAINSIEDSTKRYQATIAFTRATAWERGSASMGSVAQLMALTEANLDAAFTLAATYTNL